MEVEQGSTPTTNPRCVIKHIPPVSLYVFCAHIPPSSLIGPHQKWQPWPCPAVGTPQKVLHLSVLSPSVGLTYIHPTGASSTASTALSSTSSLVPLKLKVTTDDMGGGDPQVYNGLDGALQPSARL